MDNGMPIAMLPDDCADETEIYVGDTGEADEGDEEEDESEELRGRGVLPRASLPRASEVVA